MAAKKSKSAKNEKPGITEIINEFIQKNRKLLLISLIAIIGMIIVLIAVFSIRDSMISKAFIRVDDFSRQYQSIKNRPTDNLSDEERYYLNQEIYLLLEDLTQFGKKNSGFAGARAYAISAEIFEEMQSWSDAENAWTNAAKTASKTYFAPVAYFNAAVAAEEQGNQRKAIELYGKALEYGDTFPAAPRAQFSIGRIQESSGDRNAAIAAYQILVSRWPQDQIWVNLAYSRILALTLPGNS